MFKKKWKLIVEYPLGEHNPLAKFGVIETYYTYWGLMRHLRNFQDYNSYSVLHYENGEWIHMNGYSEEWE